VLIGWMRPWGKVLEKYDPDAGISDAFDGGDGLENPFLGQQSIGEEERVVVRVPPWCIPERRIDERRIDERRIDERRIDERW